MFMIAYIPLLPLHHTLFRFSPTINMDDVGTFNAFLGRIIIGADGHPDVAAITELTENLCETFTGLSLLSDSWDLL